MKYCLFLFLFFSSISLQAQTLTGKVIDAKTLEPLPFANVFLNNTTIGTTTELDGDFTLKNMRQPAIYEVVFSYVGYDSYKMKVSVAENNLNLDTIRLSPSEIELASLEVKSTKDTRWEKKLKKFKKVFLGDDFEPDQCTIVNPWVVDFPEIGNKLKAVASAPLEISNKVLGYKVTFYLRNFLSNSTTYLIEGNVLFEEMQEADEAERSKWMLNRALSYRHSRQHLFKAMVDRRLNREGFRLYAEMNDMVNIPTRTAYFYSQLGRSLEAYDTSAIVSPMGQSGIYKISLKGRVEVHYRKEKVLVRVYRDVFNPVSWITLNKGYVLVNKDGVELNPADVMVAGDMNKDRVAHLLPINYLPEETAREEEKQALLPLLEEKIYIQTDKPYYYPGESIWWKGYVNYRAPSLRDSLSKTVYVELVDREKGEIRQSKTYRLDSGFFNGDFMLSDQLSAGSYCLRAYTNLNRNFGDENLYVKQIPVLNLTDKARANPSGEGEMPQDSLFSVLFDKKKYNTREKITVTLKLVDEDELPLASNLSISVTDLSQVAPLESSFTILHGYSLRDSMAHTERDTLLYPIEHGVGFSGIYYNDKKQGVKIMLNVFQINPRSFYMTQTDEMGLFSLNGFSFYDTASFTIQPVGEKEVAYGKVELMKREVPPMNFKDSIYEIDFVKTESLQRIRYAPSEDSKMLEEVEIKAKKIQEEYTMEYRIKRPYGKPSYVLKAKDINASYGNLLLTLPGKFPGLIVRQAKNSGPNGSNGDGAHWVVYLQKAQTVGAREVLVTVNDCYVGGDPESILSAINPNDVESIELKTGVNVLYGASGFGGVLSIYTRQGPTEEEVIVKKNIPIIKVMGYSRPGKLSFPDYGNSEANSSLADYRSLLYWNPNIATDAKTGIATTFFYASDMPGRYRVVVEGVTSQGKPVRSVTFLEVEQR